MSRHFYCLVFGVLCLVRCRESFVAAKPNDEYSSTILEKLRALYEQEQRLAERDLSHDDIRSAPKLDEVESDDAILNYLNKQNFEAAHEGVQTAADAIINDVKAEQMYALYGHGDRGRDQIDENRVIGSDISKRPLHVPNYMQRNSQSADEPEAKHSYMWKVGNQDLFFVALVAGCSAAAIVGIVAAGFCWYRLQRNAKAAADAEYPAYGVTGPNKELSPTAVDRKLVQSAHMYHYQHQKQQMIAMEKATGAADRNASTSDVDSDEENEEGDYTVYECPGLAPTGEMEVKNPLFQDEPTPATPQVNAPPAANSGQNQTEFERQQSSKR